MGTIVRYEFHTMIVAWIIACVITSGGCNGGSGDGGSSGDGDTDADTDTDADADTDADTDTDTGSVGECDGECAANEYTECTCGTDDPCEWSGDGVCDDPCVTALVVEQMFDDSEDCGGEIDTDSDTDTGTGLTCDSVWGICTEDLWFSCPANTQPYGEDLSLDCPGNCCVAAPPEFTCNPAGTYNCVVGAECPDCWSANDTGLTCEEGRVCCYYACDQRGLKTGPLLWPPAPSR